MAKMTQHMQAQIMEGKWVEVETTDGLFYISGVMLADGGGTGIPVYWDGSFIDEDTGNGTTFKALALYYSIYIPYRGIISFEIKHGFGARLSASGYLDSTDWTVFDTVKDAVGYLEELQNED